jgi:hypothetical protein
MVTASGVISMSPPLEWRYVSLNRWLLINEAPAVKLSQQPG